MSSGHFKQDVFAQLARIGKALAHGNRLELLEFIAQGPRSVDELARLTHLSTANASKHLQELRHAGLVRARNEGLRVFYELSGSDVVALIACATSPRTVWPRSSNCCAPTSAPATTSNPCRPTNCSSVSNRGW